MVRSDVFVEYADPGERRSAALFQARAKQRRVLFGGGERIARTNCQMGDGENGENGSESSFEAK
jgi:hypothetical protein